MDRKINKERFVTSTPFFSIVLPTYNRALFISDAVESVIKQTFQDWELVIIDDASEDDTLQVLDQFDDRRIRVLPNKKNIERSASRNRGISESTGKYICFLDSDDYYLEDHLELLEKHIRQKENVVALFASSYVRKTPNGDHDVNFFRRPELTDVEQVIKYHILPGSVAIHRNILCENKFNTSMHINEDVELFARIAARYPVYYCPERTVVWRIHDANTKNCTEDYITPQINALRTMFRNPDLAGKIFSRFKRKMLSEKYALFVTYYLQKNKRCLALCYALGALWKNPGKKSISAMGAVIYSFSFGNRMRRIMRAIKQ